MEQRLEVWIHELRPNAAQQAVDGGHLALAQIGGRGGGRSGGGLCVCLVGSRGRQSCRQRIGCRRLMAVSVAPDVMHDGGVEESLHVILDEKAQFGYFSPAPLWSEPYALTVGKTLVLRYRIILHPGRGDGLQLDREWRRFQAPRRARGG